MAAVFVVLIRVKDFFIIAVYMGGLPVAEHVSRKYRNDRRTGPGDVIFGKANKVIIKRMLLSIITGQILYQKYCPMYLQISKPL